MKTNTKPTLTLRAHSIRKLTAADLRIVNGGCPTMSQCRRTDYTTS